MSERTLCGAIKASGRDCDGPVPPDAPVDLCIVHLTKAYFYVRDLLQAADVDVPPDDRCVVYYIRAGDQIKIGTSRNLWNRIGDIPHDRLLATEPGSYELERQRHEQFKAARIDRNREWFRDCPEIRKHVNALRRQYGDPVEKRYVPSRSVPVLEDAPWER